VFLFSTACIRIPDTEIHCATLFTQMQENEAKDREFKVRMERYMQQSETQREMEADANRLLDDIMVPLSCLVYVCVHRNKCSCFFF
jgi:hypothetical protein